MKEKFHKTINRNHFNSNDIYSTASNGSIYSPFSISIDDMKKLILICFEKDPDRYYNVFELQQARDKNGERKFLVIAYRKDGSTDVYHQPGYPFASQASILNEVTFIENPLENTKFELQGGCLEVFFAFKDKYQREIKVKVKESKTQRKNPFFLLAPVGVVSKEPISLPVYSLYKMSFARKKYSEIVIEIGDAKHKPDTFPLPVDWSQNYFTRYSTDTFNVDWNKNYDGLLSPLKPTKDEIEEKGLAYELVDNDGHYEIKRMTAKNESHQITIDICPPLPDIACLNEKIHLDGMFTITTDQSTGYIRGEYSLERKGDVTEMHLQPNGGWQPGEKRGILKLLFLVVKVFKEWPMSYAWNAKITVGAPDKVAMKSSWVRI